MKKNQLLEDAFDALVLKAVRGDRRAIAAIAIACGATLLKEARDALGEARANEDEDVLVDLCAGMIRGNFEFVPSRDDASEWLRARVRILATATPTDLVIARASDGDPDAVAQVLEMFTDMLVEEARSVLGDSLACDAEDIVQDLGDELLDGGLSFERGQWRGIGFLRRTVRGMARERKRAAREEAQELADVSAEEEGCE
jgi:hypothetical protein